MKKKLAILLVGTMIASSILAGCGSKKSEPTKKETSGELKGDITFWHSFTQGPRMEVIQQTADQFMKDNPGVKIKIETFSWGDFYTKWTTGLASGNVPDMSTALPGHVVEMMDLYHHIHELDCVQFLMGGMPEEVTMTGGNVAHQGEAFGDEDDMLFVNMQFSDNRYAVLEWGSAFHWPEHYVLIQGTKGAIKIDMCDCGGTLKIDGKDEHFLVHESQEEDDDRTRIYHSTEMDGAIMYGKPGKKPPMWLHSIMKNEMKYLNGILHGKEVDEEFRPLLTGEAARAAIATADACTRSRFEDRKVKLSEIIG